LVFLCSDAGKEITGQCIGLGGDKLALWAHPHEVAMAYSEGGWSSDEIADNWSSSVGSELQTYGIPFLSGSKN
jgi:hypothetical protein